MENKNYLKFIIGQKIKTGKDIWEVVNPDINNLCVKIIKCKDEYWQRYVDEGKQYNLFMHTGNDKYGMSVWEIPPEQMKRSVSQALLYWFADDEEPSFELDT